MAVKYGIIYYSFAARPEKYEDSEKQRLRKGNRGSILSQSPVARNRFIVVNTGGVPDEPGNSGTFLRVLPASAPPLSLLHC